jgi:hypothetical protein
MHTVHLLNFPNVIGTGVGITRVGGISTGEYCVKAFVTTKVQKDLLPPASILPGYIYVQERPPVRVDVEEMSIPTVPLPVNNFLGQEISAFGGMALRKRFRPASGGVSAASFRFPVGTLSIPVRDSLNPNYYCILSSNHVLAYLNYGRIGDPILQPSYGTGGIYPQDQIGVLARFVPLFFGQNYVNRVDAAIAYVYPGSVSQAVETVGAIEVVKGVDDIVVGEAVQKIGCVSGHTTGVIQATRANVWINYSLAGFGDTPAFFTDQIITDAMAMFGDSGSLLLDMDNNALGLLCAGSPTHTMYNYMSHVESDLDVYLDLDEKP